MRPNRAFALIALGFLVLAPLPAAAQGSDPQVHDYRFGWSEFTFDGPSTSGHTDEGTGTNASMPVEHVNVTALRFTLTWNDAVGDPDTLRIVVYDPDGRERARLSDTQSNGTLEAFVRVQEAPPGSATVRAESEAEAWSVFTMDFPASRKGVGAWTAEVTVMEAGDEDGTLAGIGAEEDAGQSWNLTVAGGAYVGVLQERTPVNDPDEEPKRAPDEVPPPDEDENETLPPEIPEEATGGTSILSSRGAQSALVVLAAAIGVVGALLLVRRNGSAG